MSSLNHILAALEAAADSETTTNPYRTPALLHNLDAYLGALAARPGRRVLLVGEALGYRGGLHTGIPFTSTRLLRQAPHTFLRQLRPALQLQGNDTEATAGALWEFLSGRQCIPLCWNAFPFHPHCGDNPLSNRAPGADERRNGLELLTMIVDWYQPDRVIGVGNMGAWAAQAAAPTRFLCQVRHPSFGGRKQFLAGMEAAYTRR